MITLYGIPNCDTIKKTRKWLDAAGVDYRFHDYRKDGCPPTLIRTFLQHFDVDDILNTGGTTWRKLPESARENLTKSRAIALMSSHPALIKRPLLHSGDQWQAGFDTARLNGLVERN